MCYKKNMNLLNSLSQATGSKKNTLQATNIIKYTIKYTTLDYLSLSQEKKNITKIIENQIEGHNGIPRALRTHKKLQSIF